MKSAGEGKLSPPRKDPVAPRVHDKDGLPSSSHFCECTVIPLPNIKQWLQSLQWFASRERKSICTNMVGEGEPASPPGALGARGSLLGVEPSKSLI